MMRTFLLIAVMFGVLLGGQAVFSKPGCAANEDCPQTSFPKPTGNYNDFEVGICANRYTGIAYQPYEFTSKLVACMEGTIRNAVLRMMFVIDEEFGWVVSGIATIVIMFHGVRVAMGEKELLKRTATLFIKLAFVVAFVNLLPEIVDWTFSIFKDLLKLVSGGLTPWQQIDAFLGHLVGFGPSIVLLNGLLGIIGAAAFSSSVGITVFLAGVLALLNLLNFILSLIYTYCLAFLTIGFLLILAPVMIPLSLFFYTEQYFKKWIDIMIGAMLTPILMFAFVRMFLGIFDMLIENIFDILGGNDFRAYWRSNGSLFSWLMPSDPNTNAMMQNLSRPEDNPCATRAITAPVQSYIDPLKSNAFEAGIGRFATLDFGAQDVVVVQKLSYAFIMLWIFSTLMKSMVHLIPDISASMATLLNTRLRFGDSDMVGKIQKGIDSMDSKLKSGEGINTGKLGKAAELVKQMGGMVGKRDT